MRISRNTEVIIKKGSLVEAWDKKLGNRIVEKNYKVVVVEHYIESNVNKVYWVGRHGHYCGTNIENIRIV